MKNSRIKNFASENQSGMAIVISVLLFILTITINPKSFNVNAFGSIIALTSMLALASAGQTLVIISDGIDLSVGATMSMTALLTVEIMKGQSSVKLFLIALVVSVVVGMIIGFMNGIGAIKAGIPPLVVTLYISNIVSRMQYVITGGTPEFTSVPNAYKMVVTTRFYDLIPSIVFFAGAIAVVMFIIINRTVYGRQLFLTGNNERAAYLTGINTKKLKIINYTLSGILAGVAGLIGAGNSGFINCGTFDGMTMDSIVAVVIGGTILSGGKGSYTGTIAGALLLIVLSNSLSVLQVSNSLRNLIMGIVLIILLALYNRQKAIRQ